MSPQNNLTQSRINESLRIEEDANFSAKSHFNAADIWSDRHFYIGIPATVFGLLTSAALVKDYPTLAGLCSLLATILTALITFLKPNERAAQHKSLGEQFLCLRNDTRVFRTIELLEDHKDVEVSKKLKALVARRNDLNKGSPSIPYTAFKKARTGIEQGEATHQVDQNLLG